MSVIGRGKRHPLTEEGIVIKKRLSELDMLNKDLANAVGISPELLSQILRGKKNGEKYMNEIFKKLGI